LETGLEIECCKTLTVDCLQNAPGGTVEVAYLKRRARGGEHKRLRVCDGGSTTPGGLIRRLIELTAAARRHHPSDSLWVYRGAGAFTAGIRHPQMLDAWTRRHGVVDDDGRPLRLLLCRLRKTHKALWYLKTEGHLARFAVGHTPEIATRHYADVPALRPLHSRNEWRAPRSAWSLCNSGVERLGRSCKSGDEGMSANMSVHPHGSIRGASTSTVPNMVCSSRVRRSRTRRIFRQAGQSRACRAEQEHRGRHP
jgi:hypothetical protein